MSLFTSGIEIISRPAEDTRFGFHMTPPKERITIIVTDNPIIMTPSVTTLSKTTLDRIAGIIKMITEASDIRKGRENAKAAKQTAQDRQMEAILLAMLESPTGITKGDILVAGEAVEFMATINKFRAYLRRNNVYTLKKSTKDKKPLYMLDPVR